jgi:hypothetical protein
MNGDGIDDYERLNVESQNTHTMTDESPAYISQLVKQRCELNLECAEERDG